MTKEMVHFEALGYEPFRMKPVHFAAGFFLSVAGQRYELERLNQAAVIKHNTGLREEYAHENLLMAFKEAGVVDASMSEAELKGLRVQINGVVANDDAVYGSFGPYKKPPGVAYTMASDRLLFDHEPLDGYSGHVVHLILGATASGKEVIEFAKRSLEFHDSTLERFIAPLLERDELPQPWRCQYSGEMEGKRVKLLASMMEPQTEALATLCRNLQCGFSHETRLRNLVVALCSWLFIYLHKRAAAAHSDDPETPLLLMDFLGARNSRLRAASRLSFARHRGRFFESYESLRKKGRIEFEEDTFAPKQPKRKKAAVSASADFKFLEEHYSDLAVRIGFAQPRAWQARRKHYELQPDTARMLLLSLITQEDPLVTFEELATSLRRIWGVCFGGCDDDVSELRKNGYADLDDDADLKANTESFVDLLKRLNLASEPSDGLILCAINAEVLP